MSTEHDHAFRERFAKLASGVRRWLAVRSALAGLGVGLLAGGACAAGAWKLGWGDARLAVGVGLAALGAVAALVFDHRRRMSSSEVALYLDRRLDSHEAISTAIDPGLGGPAREHVLARANDALAGASSKRTRPRLLSKLHALIPPGAAAVAFMAWIPLPPAPPPPPPPPGMETVSMPTAPELDRVIETLQTMKGRDPEQQKRIEELAEKAKKLREKLATGATKRDLQADLSELSEGIAAERMDLGSGDRRRGFEAALAKLQAGGLEAERRALADRDLTKFDERMDRAAKNPDKSTRDRAKKALEEAAEAARKEGAPDVAKALEEQKKRFEQAEREAQALRDMSKAMGDKLPDDAKKDLEKLDKTGDPEAEKKLAEALSKALEGMSEGDKKKLAEAMAKQAKTGADESTGKPLSAEDKKRLEELAKELASPEGQKKMQEALKKMAEEGKLSEEAARQQGLAGAEQNASDLRAKVGSSSDAKAQGTSGPGGGPGNSKGPKQPPPGASSSKPFNLHATSKMNSAAPMPGNIPGRTDARPGEKANVVGTGALGRVGPSEIGGVSESDVPAEYREQVGRYFQP